MKSAEIEMLRRECKIVNNDNPTAQVLTVCFLKPKELKGGEFVATAKLSCVYFEESIETRGIDDMHAFACLLAATQGRLMGKTREGYQIWWLKEADINFSNFWQYKP